MIKKIVLNSFIIFLFLFFFTDFLNSIPLEITEGYCSETRGPRLSIKGEIEIPQNEGAPLICRFRTCQLEDFLKPDRSIGFVSALRSNPEEMKYFIGGEKSSKYTLQRGYAGIWRKLQIENDNGNYTPATLFVLSLLDQDIGYFAIERHTSTQLIFFGSIIREFQNKGIMTSVLGYLIEELFPAFRKSPLTSVKSLAEHKELLIAMDPKHPLAQKIVTESKPKFEKAHELSIDHELAPTKDRLEVAHQFKIDLVKLYSKREASEK